MLFLCRIQRTWYLWILLVKWESCLYYLLPVLLRNLGKLRATVGLLVAAHPGTGGLWKPSGLQKAQRMPLYLLYLRSFFSWTWVIIVFPPPGGVYQLYCHHLNSARGQRTLCLGVSPLPLASAHLRLSFPPVTVSLTTFPLLGSVMSHTGWLYSQWFSWMVSVPKISSLWGYFTSSSCELW